MSVRSLDFRANIHIFHWILKSIKHTCLLPVHHRRPNTLYWQHLSQRLKNVTYALLLITWSWDGSGLENVKCLVRALLPSTASLSEKAAVIGCADICSSHFDSGKSDLFNKPFGLGFIKELTFFLRNPNIYLEKYYDQICFGSCYHFEGAVVCSCCHCHYSSALPTKDIKGIVLFTPRALQSSRCPVIWTCMSSLWGNTRLCSSKYIRALPYPCCNFPRLPRRQELGGEYRH